MVSSQTLTPLTTLTIGVDIGGTKVLGGVVDSSGKILTTHRKDTPKQGGEALTQTISEVILELKKEFDAQAVGISAAGFVSSDRKTMLATPNISGWNGINLQETISSKVGLPVVIDFVTLRSSHNYLAINKFFNNLFFCCVYYCF